MSAPELPTSAATTKRAPRCRGRAPRAVASTSVLQTARHGKLKIAVVNTSSGARDLLFPSRRRRQDRCKDAIREAGGLPFEIRTTAPSDFVHSAGHAGYLIRRCATCTTQRLIETQVEGAELDGMICLTSCDKTVPGHLPWQRRG